MWRSIRRANTIWKSTHWLLPSTGVDPLLVAWQQCRWDSTAKQIRFDYRAKPPKPTFVDFRSLDDPYHVMNSLAGLKDDLQMFHVTAALSRLKNLEVRPPQEILEEATSLGQNVLRHATGNDVVGVFVALGKLRFVNLELLNGLANRAVKEGCVSGFSVRELASVVHSVVLLLRIAERKAQTREGRSQGYDSNAMYGLEETNKFLHEILDELALHRRSDREMVDRLSSVVSSLSLLGRRDSRLDTLMAENLKSSQRLSSMDADGISNTILTIGKTGEKVELLQSLCNEIQKPENLQGLEWERLVSIANALSGLGFSDRGFWKVLLEEMCKSDRIARYRPEDFDLVLTVAHKHKINKELIGGALVDAIMKDEKYERFTNYQLACVISSLGKYNMGDDTRILTLLPRAVRVDSMSEWPTQLISGLAYACFRFRAKRSPLFDVLAKEMARPSRLETFSPVSTITLLHSFIMLNWYHQETFTVLLKECLQEIYVGSLGKNSITKLAVLLGRTNKNNLPILLKPFTDRLVDPDIMREYSPDDLTTVIYNLGRFRDVPPRDVEPLLTEAEKRLEELDPPHVSAMILGFSRLGLYDKKKIDKLCRHAVLSSDVTKLDGLDLVAMMTGMADLNHKSEVVVDELMKHLVKGIKYRKFYLQGLEKVLSALVKMDMTKADHCLDLVKELGKKKERLKHAKADTICNLLYVMGKESLTENKLVHQIFRKIANGKRNGKFDEFDMVRIRRAVYDSGIIRGNLLDVVRPKGIKPFKSTPTATSDEAIEAEEEEDYGTKLLSLIL